MPVAKDVIGAEHVPSAKWFRDRLKKIVTHRLGCVRDNAPGRLHRVGGIGRPGWTCEIITGGKVFCRARTRGGPSALFFCGVCRYNNGIISETLAALDLIQKEGVHEG